jgi:two-component system response regulator DesR
VIRVVLAFDDVLMRGALASVLAAEPDISVVGEVDRGSGISSACEASPPDVAVVGLGLTGDGGYVAGPCPTLVLVGRRQRVRDLRRVVAAGPTVGVLTIDVSPQRVVAGVRRLARGESVIDPDLVLAALTDTNPLSAREIDILERTARGATVTEIADSLSLSPGTVRNHLGRITRKTNARTRVEAVHVATQAGWI